MLIILCNDGAQSWVKLQINYTKVNVDAAIFKVRNALSFSMVARDHDVRLTEARFSSKEGDSNPENA